MKQTRSFRGAEACQILHRTEDLMNHFPAPQPPSLARPRDYLESVKGLGFVRSIIARALTRDDDPATALAYARARWGASSKPVAILKAADIPALSTGATDIVSDGQSSAAEFVGAVREQTIFGKALGWRRQPPQIRTFTQLTGATGHWVKEGRAVPATGMTFAQEFTRTLKIAALAIFTDELLRSTDAVTELGIRADLIAALAEEIDAAALDPANAGLTDEKPASLTNGLDPVSTAPGDIQDIRDAFTALIANFAGDLQRAVVVARPELLAGINANSFGGFGARVGARGGELGGLPAVASKGLPLDAGGRQQLVLLDPDGVILTTDDTATEIKVTRAASIEMTDAPTGDGVEPTAASVVSLFQVNAVAVMALAHQNWRTARLGSVAIMDGLQIGADLT
jgi:hypothetical protein